MSERVTFYHAPQSRSGGTLVLFEELGVDYDLQRLDLKAGTQRGDAYLAVNPMGKVPAIVHRGALVSEQPAVMMYLAELYPERGLAPLPGDPLRGPYLRWMVFYGSCLEPAVVDRSLQRDPAPLATSPYGTFEMVVDTLCAQLAGGPWLLGERFSAADVLYGTALSWITRFGLLPERPEISAYVARFTARPAYHRAMERDQAWADEAAG